MDVVRIWLTMLACGERSHLRCWLFPFCLRELCRRSAPVLGAEAARGSVAIQVFAKGIPAAATFAVEDFIPSGMTGCSGMISRTGMTNRPRTNKLLPKP